MRRPAGAVPPWRSQSRAPHGKQNNLSRSLRGVVVQQLSEFVGRAVAPQFGGPSDQPLERVK